MSTFRDEKDSMGTVQVPSDKFYGAQTQRSLNNFKIGKDRMPLPQIYAMVKVKKACAIANHRLHKLSEAKFKAIQQACDAILLGQLDDHFVLSVYQTGSGTQSNMNVNEVIANYGNHLVGEKLLHPNDDVNMSQSSNDVFPTAMHIAARDSINQDLLPALDKMMDELALFIKDEGHFEKVGRTHLQDATNLTIGQEFSAYHAGLNTVKSIIMESTCHLDDVALGGSAVGTGINTPEGFLDELEKSLLEVTSHHYRTHTNKFEQLSLKIPLAHVSSSTKLLASTLFKMANDIRFLASGPRVGYGELSIPANEPGSSIMPGKINPTQCESMMMVAMTVMGNDEIIGYTNALGNFELNVMMPLLIDKLLESITLLSESMSSFVDHLLVGMHVNQDKLAQNVQQSLMMATALNPYLGYETVAALVKKAHETNRTIKEVGLEMKLFNELEYDKWMSRG